MKHEVLLSRLQAHCKSYNLPTDGEVEVLVQRLLLTNHWQEFADKYRVVKFDGRVYDLSENADIEALLKAKAESLK